MLCFDVTDAGNGASLFYLYNRWGRVAGVRACNVRGKGIMEGMGMKFIFRVVL